MKDNLKNNSFFARHHIAIMYVKDPILAGCLVFGHDFPPMQLGSIAGLNLMFGIAFIVFMPYQDFLSNFIEIVNYFIFFAATFSFY